MLAMGQFSNVLLAVHKAHTVPRRALDCGLGLGGLKQVYGPIHYFYSLTNTIIVIFVTLLASSTNTM